VTLSGIECPKCGKHSVVPKTSGDTVYVCLGCEFKGNSNPPPPKPPEPNLGAIAAIGIVTFLILSVLSQLRPQPAGIQAQRTPSSSTIPK
jgi:hypothetical protein